jgi:hypothetical protein
MNEWDKLFDILQVLNPISDWYKKAKVTYINEQDRWDDICYYMDALKPGDDEGICEEVSAEIQMSKEKNATLERARMKLKNKYNMGVKENGTD